MPMANSPKHFNMSKQTVNELSTVRKYTIAAHLAKYTPEQRAVRRHQIITGCNVTKQTLSEWENIKADESRELPLGASLVICEVLAIKPTELITKI